jgi:hypothetical protein
MHPAWVRENMSIFKQGSVVNAWMRDNSFHWFNLIVQAHARLLHIDIYSLPLFLDTLTGLRTPDWLYQLPTFLILALSVLVARMKDSRMRMEAALILLMATSINFFIGFPIIWEYHYTSILPVAAMLLVLRGRGVFYEPARPWMLALAACAWLPSLYVFTEGRAIATAVLLTVWVDRVLPVTLLFVLMAAVLIRCVYTGSRTTPAKAH